MLIHPDLMLTLANDRHRELLDRSERSRVLDSARTARRARKARKASIVRGQPAGNLSSCEPSAAVPAR